eukprot:10499312-Ditylum_brightwellii.AAC.1
MEGAQTAETIKQTMKDCGEMVVDAKAGYQTKMQIKWVFAEGCKRFNIHGAMITILEKMQEVDP